MEVFRYYTLYRPPAPGAIPKGCIHQQTVGSRPFIKEVSHTVWGIVEYDRQLTPEEISQYELAPANMVQMPISAE